MFSWLLDEGWRSYLEQDVESYTGYKVMLEALGIYVGNTPEDEWQKLVVDVGQKFDIPLSLTTYATQKNIAKDEQKLLKTGKTSVYYDDEVVYLYHQIGQSNTLLSLGPAKMPTRPRLEAVVRAVILAVFGLLILIWLWPISKDLDGLRKTADELGTGNFNAKAPEAKSDMMASMVHTFNMMAERVKRLIEAHKELTNAVAHELRTPLARSKFALQMLDMSDDPEKQKRYKQQITNDVCELEELINEMLVYASFDTDKPELKIETHDIGKLLEAQLESHQQFDGKIQFKNKAEGLVVDCDSHFLERAFVNYVTNAQKYGNDLIKVTLSSQDDSYIIAVEDNGKGISDDFKPTIFDAFSRGDNSRNRETGGFGLGLAIVNRIMEWHQGKAWVEDSELGGACFYLKLPIKAK